MPPTSRVPRGVGARWRARAAKRAVAEEQTSVMARKLRVCCVARADLSEVGLSRPFFGRLCRRRREFRPCASHASEVWEVLPEKSGTLPEKSGKFHLSSDISDGSPIKFDLAQVVLSFE